MQTLAITTEKEENCVLLFACVCICACVLMCVFKEGKLSLEFLVSSTFFH